MFDAGHVTNSMTSLNNVAKTSFIFYAAQDFGDMLGKKWNTNFRTLVLLFTVFLSTQGRERYSSLPNTRASRAADNRLSTGVFMNISISPSAVEKSISSFSTSAFSLVIAVGITKGLLAKELLRTKGPNRSAGALCRRVSPHVWVEAWSAHETTLHTCEYTFMIDSPRCRTMKPS